MIAIEASYNLNRLSLSISLSLPSLPPFSFSSSFAHSLPSSIDLLNFPLIPRSLAYVSSILYLFWPLKPLHVDYIWNVMIKGDCMLTGYIYIYGMLWLVLHGLVVSGVSDAKALALAGTPCVAVRFNTLN